MANQDLINRRFIYAVVGATTNQEKYGYRVLKDLARAQFNVVGVNPKYKEIEGIPVYSTLQDVPGKVDVAIFVVPPSVGIGLLAQVEEKGILKLWLQPGAESDGLVRMAEDMDFQLNDPGSCIMVVRGRSQGITHNC